MASYLTRYPAEYFKTLVTELGETGAHNGRAVASWRVLVEPPGLGARPGDPSHATAMQVHVWVSYQPTTIGAGSAAPYLIAPWSETFSFDAAEVAALERAPALGPEREVAELLRADPIWSQFGRGK